MRSNFFLFLLLFLISACTQSNESLSESKNTEAKTDENEGNKIGAQLNNEAPSSSDHNSEANASSEYEDLDWKAYEESMNKDFSFVIIISTKSYDAALERAKEASKKLGYPLDLRELHPNAEIGLSLPKDVCEAICGGDVVEYPQYLPRIDYGETKYVSIEYSNGYAGFTKGYYIVVIASGEKGDPIIQEALSEAKKVYDGAYAKTCKVWMGCGC